MSDWIALGELIIGIIGIIVGVIGGKELKEANNIKVQFRDLKAEIEKIELNNSQVATTINNNGADASTVGYIAGDKAKEMLTKAIKITDIEKYLDSNKYGVPIVWCGTEEEYKKLKQSDEYSDRIIYFIED